MMRFLAVAAISAVFPLHAQNSSKQVDQLIDHIVEREGQFLQTIQKRTPLIETYIQEYETRVDGEDRAIKDRYFLGRFELTDALAYQSLIERNGTGAEKPGARQATRSSGTDSAGTTDPSSRRLIKLGGGKNQSVVFQPRGFAQMTIMDLHEFNRKTYTFEFARQEFLGDVRCMVFDVAPIDRRQSGKFIGRIWVEDKDDSIVRFNGTYTSEAQAKKSAPTDLYFHFDSWRMNVKGSQWLPSNIYVEEESVHGKDPAHSRPRFRAQVRIWDYVGGPTGKMEELTNILIEKGGSVKDMDTAENVSPLESQRLWEREAERNILSRLQRAGLLASPGPVDEVLNTVVNNLIVSANLNVQAQCRVLLTTPIESFAIGHTIVLSRSLIDVLPDETSLALVLAIELSQIDLGYRVPTRFAFNDQTMLTDVDLLQRLHFARSPQEMDGAVRKTIDIIKASPYKNTATAGLFLRMLAARGPALRKHHMNPSGQSAEGGS